MTTMEPSKLHQEKVSELLKTNKFAILLKIAVMFVPMCAILIINDRVGGNDFVPLSGDIVLVGSPLVYLGMILLWQPSGLRQNCVAAIGASLGWPNQIAGSAQSPSALD